MQATFTNITPLLTLSFLVAFVYSSVGHGGASGYLAVLSFYSFPHEQMASSALCLNILVSGMAFRAFAKARHFSWKLTWPFIAISIPAAFIGGLIKVPKSFYSFLLAGVLLFVALRLIMDTYFERKETALSIAPFFPSLFIGAGIGLISGVVGIGGGIFLSPLLLFFHWANPKQTAATSAFFIFLNSLAGLLGRTFRQNFEVFFSPPLVLIVLAAFVGGLVGSRLGANHFSYQWLKRMLSFVLFIAAVKLLWIS